MEVKHVMTTAKLRIISLLTLFDPVPFTATVPADCIRTDSVALVRERTIPTKRPPLVGEVSANFCG
jgi:hypothetical protein